MKSARLWKALQISKIYGLYTATLLLPLSVIAFYELFYAIFINNSYLNSTSLFTCLGLIICYTLAHSLNFEIFSYRLAIILLNILIQLLFFIIATVSSEYKTLLILCSTTHCIIFQNSPLSSFWQVSLNTTSNLGMWLGLEYLQGQLVPGNNQLFILLLSYAVLAPVLSHKISTDNQLDMLNSLKKLKKEHFYMNEILQAFHSGIMIFSRDGKIRMKNEYIDRVFKYPSCRQLLKIISNLSYAISFSKSSKPIQDILESLKQETETQKSLGIVEFETLHLEFSCCYVYMKGMPYLLVSVKDVTSLLEQEGQRIEERCRRLIVRSISHELRTPVNAVIHTVDEIGKLESDPGISKLAGIAYSYSHHLKYVINDIIDLSLILSDNIVINKRYFNLKNEIYNAYEIMKPQFQAKGINFYIFVDSLLPVEIYNDPERIKQILLNLLSNAVKFTSVGSVNMYAILTADSSCHVIVKDTGSGISPSKLATLFNQDIRLDSSSNTSFGIGLYLSNKLAKLIGSGLKVTSDSTSGSMFEFSIQLSTTAPLQILDNTTQDEDASDCEESTKQIDLPVSMIHIPSPRSDHSIIPTDVLIVDDTPINREILKRLLSYENIFCDEACDGAEAVEMVQSSDKIGKLYQVIIMDCDMPKMTGLEAASAIQNLHKSGLLSRMPVILAHSAFSGDDDIRMALESGMSDYITKPISRNELLSKIKLYYNRIFF